jgi:hypothetical protein
MNSQSLAATPVDGTIAPANTSLTARCLLLTTIILIPLQDHFPAMGGFGRNNGIASDQDDRRLAIALAPP